MFGITRRFWRTILVELVVHDIPAGRACVLFQLSTPLDISKKNADLYKAGSYSTPSETIPFQVQVI